MFQRICRNSISVPTSLLALFVLLALPMLATAQTEVAHDTPSAGRLEAASGTYTDPLKPQISDGGIVESCADPAIIRGQDDYWYLYCTTDPLNGADRNEAGDLNFHLVPILRSIDLVDWTYVGDAFSQRPDWAEPTAGIWAPDIQYLNGQNYIYYGSYYGGIEVRELSSDGFSAPSTTATAVAVPNRYEGSEVFQHDGYYYLFVSATNCCNGPLTGYSLFAGRSTSPTGPFVDREGVS